MHRAITMPRAVYAFYAGRPLALLTLDEKARIAARITVSQIRSPLLGWAVDEYRFLRFWADASPAMRTALANGQPVPFARLPVSAHEFLYAHRGDSDGRYGDEMGVSLFDEPEFRALPRYQPNLGKPDVDYAGIYSKWLAPSASLTLKMARLPGIYLEQYQQVVGPSMLVALDSGDVSDEDLNSLGKTNFANTLAMEFHFQARSGVDYVYRALNIEVGKEARMDRQGWPEDLLRRITAAKARQSTDDRGEGRPGKAIPPP